MNSEKIKSLVKKAVEELATKLDLLIFDLKISETKRKFVVEIFIDKLQGYVGVSDCENFSRKIEPWFDSSDLFEKPYDLIVSSPGLERPLRTSKDYERFFGKLAKIVLIKRIDEKRKIIGYIGDLENENLTLKEKSSNKEYTIDLKNIKKSNLEIDI